MHKGYLKAGSVLAALAVIFGAFAAHAIKSKVSADTLAVFETGVRYQMYHSLALVLTGILYKEFAAKYLLWAGRLFIVGIILFSTSLYLLTYFKAIEKASMLWLGAVTPFGGVCFIAGWVLLFTGFFNKNFIR
jgi:uncharacterized membrane protein YgdD (TMEM256/DUF423 family)